MFILKRPKLKFLILFLLMTLSFCLTAFAADHARLGAITGDKVNIRKEASSEAEIIGQYSKDTRIVIIGSKGSFFQVKYNGETGYVSDEFAVAFDYKKGKVTASNVNLREGPNTDSEIITTIDKNDSIYVFGDSNDFYRVTYGEKSGYVAKEFVSVDGESSSSKSSSSKSETKTSSKSSEKSKTVTRNVKTGSYTDEELYLIAQLIYCEGKGSGTTSYKALASVVYNRIASKSFPNSVEGVVFQDGQFTVVRNREKFLATKPDRKSQDAVYSVFVEGEVTLPADVMYFKSDHLSKDWGSSREYYTTVGGNMYYT